MKAEGYARGALVMHILLGHWLAPPLIVVFF